jgi:hypothetical protein
MEHQAVAKAHDLLDVATRHPESNAIAKRCNGTGRNEAENSFGSNYLEAENRIQGTVREYSDEGLALAKQLREIPASPIALSEAARALRSVRNTKANALYDQIRRLRAAARFVFRNHPEIAREATSPWVRRKRAEQRLAAANAEPEIPSE